MSGGIINETTRPGRPLGVSLAIVVSLILYTILPLLQVGFLWIVQERTAAIRLPLPEGGESEVPLAVGGSLGGLDVGVLWLQVTLAIVFLVICVMAWLGRPPAIRWIMTAAVVGLTLTTGAITIAQVSEQLDLRFGLDSAAAIGQSLAWGRFVAGALVALYVVWYLNRAPARAFYRGCWG